MSGSDHGSSGSGEAAEEEVEQITTASILTRFLKPYPIRLSTNPNEMTLVYGRIRPVNDDGKYLSS